MRTGIPIRVLIIDDDEDFLSVLKMDLENAGKSLNYLDLPTLQLTCLQSPTEALEILQGGKVFHAIITDIKMPVHGIDFINKAHQICPSAGFLILTGFTEDYEWSLGAPQVFRLEKPHKIKEVMSFIFGIVKVLDHQGETEVSRIINQLKAIDTREVEIKNAEIVEKLSNIGEDVGELHTRILQNGLATDVRKLADSSLRLEKLSEDQNTNLSNVCSFYNKFIYLCLGIFGSIIAKIVFEMLGMHDLGLKIDRVAELLKLKP